MTENRVSHGALKRWKRLSLLGIIFTIFIGLQVYQALRVPRIGDLDILRVGLLVFNRYDSQHFQNDLAMQVGVWWPYYTPVYLSILGVFYTVLNNYELMMLVIMVINYIVLLSGFYVLGRRLGLSFLAATGFALLSGFYIPSALGAPWNGLRLDMAAARNIYQALLPWILATALELYRRFPNRIGYWLLFGFVVGLSVNLHPLTGPFLIGVLGLMMVAGWLSKRFNPRCIVAFSLGILPGLALIYITVYLLVADVSIQRAAEGIISGEAGLFQDLAKANLAFYRLPSWWSAIGVYTILSAITLVGLLRALHLKHPSAIRQWWVIFGLTQFFGAMCLQVVDWLVILVAVDWVRRVREEQDSEVMSLNMLFLMGCIAQVLCLGGVMAIIGLNGIFPPAASIARAFIRGGHLPYAPLIIFAALTFWYWLQDERWNQKKLLIITISATFGLGYHLDARGFTLEAIPYSDTLSLVGQIIPIDPWPYAGVIVLLLWTQFDGVYRPLRYGLVTILVFQTVTRILAAPASDLVTVAFGGIVGVTAYMWGRNLISGRLLMPVMLTLTTIVLVLPINGRSVLQAIQSESYRALQRNWSQTDSLSRFYSMYRIGTWIDENTPQSALVLTTDAFLRYWTLRSSFGGRQDLNFLMRGSEERRMVAQAYSAMPTMDSSPGEWIDFARQRGADYIILTMPIDISPADASIVYQNSEYVVYELVSE